MPGSGSEGPRTRAVRSTILVGAALALWAVPAPAQEFAGRPVGGRGGTSFELDCGPDGVLVGISGTADDRINQLVAHCRQVQNTGEWNGSPFTRGGAGDPEGAPFSLRCGQNRAVADIRGTYGPYVHTLSINCRRLNDEGTTEGPGEEDGPAGSGGTRQFGWFTCPRSGGRSTSPFLPARGLNGSASGFIHSLALTCGAPRVVIATSPELLSPANGSDAQSFRPTFRWSAVPAATAYRLCVTRTNQTQNSCGVLDRRTSRTSFTPSADLTFEGGQVLWNVQACDEQIRRGGCGPFSRPWRLGPPGRITFAELAPTFRHPRCVNCHAVSAGGFTPGEGLPGSHPEVSPAMNAAQNPSDGCGSCHTDQLTSFVGNIDPGWRSPPPDLDFDGRSNSQLCDMARQPISGHSPLEHMTEDRLILWAVGVGRVPGGVLPTAPPNDIEAWRSLVELWVEGGMQCP